LFISTFIIRTNLIKKFKVETEIVKKVPKAQRVFVEPCTEDDWEILVFFSFY